MSKRTLSWIEGFGLLLLLFAFFTQLVEEDIQNKKIEYESLRIHEKLDALWTVISDQYAENHPEHNVHMAINFKSYADGWKIYSEGREELSTWEKTIGADIFPTIRIIIFVIGSILIIAPKFIREKESTIPTLDQY